MRLKNQLKAMKLVSTLPVNEHANHYRQIKRLVEKKNLSLQKAFDIVKSKIVFI